MASVDELLSRLSVVESQEAQATRKGLGMIGTDVAKRAEAVVKEPRQALTGVGEAIIGKGVFEEPFEAPSRLGPFTPPAQKERAPEIEPEELTERERLARETARGVGKVGASVALSAAIPGTGLLPAIARGVVSELPFQLENIREQRGKEVAKGLALAGLFGFGEKVVSGGAKITKEILDDFGDTVSGMSRDALRTYGFFGTSKAFQKVKNVAGKQAEIAGKLQSIVNNPSRFLRGEKKVIDKALKQSKMIDITPVVDALEKRKPALRAIPQADEAVKEIDGLIDRLRSIARPKGEGVGLKAKLQRNIISAENLLEVRRQWDTLLDDVFTNPQKVGYADFVDKALQDANKVNRELLRKATPEQFKAAMEELSTKLEAIGELKRFVRGRTQGQRVESAERFLLSFGRETNPKVRQQMLDNFDKALGQDFGGDVRALIMANDIIDPESIIKGAPKAFRLGQADISLVRKALGSPLLQGPVLRGAELAEQIGGGVSRLVSPATSPAIRRRALVGGGRKLFLEGKEAIMGKEEE